MIRFVSIEIENFSSIEHLYLEFENGIYTLLGDNGSGKTSILMALLQGLYNRNIKNEADNIDETYNKITGKPYCITIKFIKNDIEYVVVNDRAKNRIDIFENGKNIAKKGIKSALKQIEDIIGIDYKVFSAFYYLSIGTLNNVFDVTNEHNLVYRFFDIETIEKIAKEFRQLQRTYKQEMSMYMANIKSIDRQLNTLTNFEEIDVEKLLNKKSILLESLLSLKESKDYKKVELLENQISALENTKKDLMTEQSVLRSKIDILTKQIKEFEKGECPVCGQSVVDRQHKLQDELNDIKVQYKEVKEKLKEIEEKRNKIAEVLSKIKREIEVKKNDIEREINTIETQLLLYERNKEQYKMLSENVQMLEEQKKSYLQSYNEKKEYLIFIEIVLSIIKSQQLVKKYLQNFVLLFNKKIKELSDKLKFDTEIVVYEFRGKLEFKFIYKGVEKTINSLSSGEKTRASLIVLFAMLETLQLLSSIELNVLALDEILGVLDRKGVKLLKQMLLEYKKNKSIFLIQHHQEIENDFFDYVIEVRKEHGLTKIEEKRNK